MLAAGGTGGHLFPAFALAQELARRDVAVDLVTDMRGDRYGADFPARAGLPRALRHARRSARRSPPPRTGWIGCSRGIAAAYKLLGNVKPGAVVGFGGYPAFPPLVCGHACAASPPPCTSRTPCWAAPTACWPSRVTAIATSFETTKLPRRPARPGPA